MTPDKINRLLELAGKATPGKWRETWRRGHRVIIEREDGDELFHDLIARVSGLPTDAAFIAACDPDTIRELCEAARDLESLKAKVANIPPASIAYAEGYKAGNAALDPLLRSDCKLMEERDGLKALLDEAVEWLCQHREYDPEIKTGRQWCSDCNNFLRKPEDATLIDRIRQALAEAQKVKP